MSYCVCILLLSDRSFYTGITNDLKQRLIQHNRGDSKSTRHCLPAALIFHRCFDTRQAARRMELKIKNKGAVRFLLNVRFQLSR